MMHVTLTFDTVHVEPLPTEKSFTPLFLTCVDLFQNRFSRKFIKNTTIVSNNMDPDLTFHFYALSGSNKTVSEIFYMCT